jgi:hypothetical protein
MKNHDYPYTAGRDLKTYNEPESGMEARKKSYQLYFPEHIIVQKIILGIIQNQGQIKEGMTANVTCFQGKVYPTLFRIHKIKPSIYKPISINK